MGNVIIDGESIEITIETILDDYRADLQETIKKETKAIGKKAVKELKATSPQDSGVYAKGWRSKVTKVNNKHGIVIYNAKRAGLTHLLENGHVSKNKYGAYGRVQPYPHIRKVETKYNAIYTKFMENLK